MTTHCPFCGHTIKKAKADVKLAPDVVRHIFASKRKRTYLAREYQIPPRMVTKIKAYANVQNALKGMATYAN